MIYHIQHLFSEEISGTTCLLANLFPRIAETIVDESVCCFGESVTARCRRWRT